MGCLIHAILFLIAYALWVNTDNFKLFLAVWISEIIVMKIILKFIDLPRSNRPQKDMEAYHANENNEDDFEELEIFNYCQYCGKEIPYHETMCDDCRDDRFLW